MQWRDIRRRHLEPRWVVSFAKQMLFSWSSWWIWRQHVWRGWTITIHINLLYLIFYDLCRRRLYFWLFFLSTFITRFILHLNVYLCNLFFHLYNLLVINFFWISFSFHIDFNQNRFMLIVSWYYSLRIMSWQNGEKIDLL